ncbi:uncharacterized protein LOC129909044 [Episyrphus balteatus]|uniref:uncharacterized protein LOC129909044 n=1 Tax=Episyrphus balteatus TaxID=286459 RepID=UPI0024869B57|nr:uncharacterized protein LOC129909044 [Episyrphus balteatus]
MNSFSIISILIFLTICVFKSATGLKWIPIEQDRELVLPDNIILIDDSERKWVGRTNVSDTDEIYPGEIHSNGEVHYKPYRFSQLHIKSYSEILTTSPSDNCQWKPYYYRNHYSDIDHNAVRAGVDSDGDPIFVGRTYVRDNEKFISSIYLPNRKITQRWQELDEDDHPYEQWQYLSCDTNKRWVDFETNHLPDNAVSGGKTIQNYEMYVARLKLSDGNFITGYVIPEMGAAVFDDNLRKEKSDSDEYNNESNETNDQTGDSDIVQILLGDSNEYEWIFVADGMIPDNAVVNGKQKLELAYVARINKSIRHITQTEARELKSPFDILVKNDINYDTNDI